MKTLEIMKRFAKSTTVLMLLLFVAITQKTDIKADTKTVDDVEWTIAVDADGTVEICGCDASSEAVTVPAAFDGHAVTSIADNAFYESEITSITIPEGVTRIGSNAFEECSKLTSATLPSTLTSIGECAFKDCVALTSITVPASVTSIGEGAFGNCSSMTDLTLEAGNKNYCSENGILFDISKTTIIACPGAKTGTFVVPSTVKTLAQYSLCGTGFSKVVLPDSVTKIKAWALGKMPNLTQLVISNNLKTITPSVLTGTKNLSAIYYMGTKKQYLTMTDYTHLQSCAVRYFMQPSVSVGSDTYEFDDEVDKTASISVTGVPGEDQSGNSTGTLSYQWYVNKTASNEDGTLIKDETSDTLSIDMTVPGKKYYYCVATYTVDDISLSTTSDVMSVNVKCASCVVSFVTNCNVTIEDQIVAYNKAAECPEEIEREGYMFGGWYTDEALSKAYNFDTLVKVNTTLYAKWEIDYQCLIDEIAVVNAKMAITGFSTHYTESSVAFLQKILNSANSMVTNKSAASGEEVISMVNALKGALKALVVVVDQRPTLAVTDGVVSAMVGSDQFNILKYVKDSVRDAESFDAAFSDSACIKGEPEDGTVTLNTTGYYSFYVKDDVFGDEYYLVAYYNAESGSLIDFSFLSYEISVAQSKYDYIPDSNSGLAVGSAYSDPDSKAALLDAIENAQLALENSTTQNAINAAVEALQKAESAFDKTVQIVLWEFIHVDGSTVTVRPSENSSIYRVMYNADEDGNLVNGIWKDYSSCNYENNQVSRYTNFIWENVPDGVYTFAVTIKNNSTGKTSTSYNLVVVDTENDDASLAKDFLTRLVGMAQDCLDNVIVKSEAKIGDTYTPDPKYNSLAAQIKSSNTLIANDSAEYSKVVTQCYNLFSAMKSMKQHTYVMEEGDSSTATITVKDKTITVTKKELQQIIIARGVYTSLNDLKKTSYKTYWPTKISQAIDVEYSGTYTLYIAYADGTNEIRTAEVTDSVSPFTVSEADGKIHIDNNSELTVTKTGYCYGDCIDLTDDSYMIYTGFESDLNILGNGDYTIYLETSSGEKFYETITISSCTHPVIIVGTDAVTPYTYGYDITTAAYARGSFDNWGDMYDSAVAIEQNKEIKMSEFESGKTYTFYFKAKDDTEYFVPITIE